MKKLVRQSLLVVFCVLVLAELYYRIEGSYYTYSEKTWGEYATYYSQVEDTWYDVFNPDSVRRVQSLEFNYVYPVNSYGICDKEIPTAKSDSTVRIVIFGDSFIEGVGAPYDSSVPRLLEKEFARKNKRSEIINAGISGSDIFYEYTLYRDKLKKLNPDIVIVTINSSDYIDYVQRGGMERFHADGTTHNRKAPWYEKLYHYSHLYRALTAKFAKQNYVGTFISRQEYFNQSEYFNRTFISLLKQFNEESKKNGSSFCVVTYCMPHEILSTSDLDSKNCQNLNQLSLWSGREGISSINLVEIIKNRFGGKPKEVYAYAQDGHYKPIGYSYMANVLCDSLVKRGLTGR